MKILSLLPWSDWLVLLFFLAAWMGYAQFATRWSLKRPSILADALEAVLGAVYLDAGYAAADALVQRIFAKVEVNPEMQAVGKDPKTELQEWLQARKFKLPIYRVVGTLGAAHKQTFDVECEVPELARCERGIGGSRRAGEQAAAAAMLDVIKELK